MTVRSRMLLQARMGNWKWVNGNEKIRNGKWEIGNREWGMENEEWGIRKRNGNLKMGEHLFC